MIPQNHFFSPKNVNKMTLINKRWLQHYDIFSAAFPFTLLAYVSLLVVVSLLLLLLVVVVAFFPHPSFIWFSRCMLSTAIFFMNPEPLSIVYAVNIATKMGMDSYAPRKKVEAASTEKVIGTGTNAQGIATMKVVMHSSTGRYGYIWDMTFVERKCK